MTSIAHHSRTTATPAACELETFDELESLQSEWTPLAEQSGNVFATWEWMSVWHRHFAHDRPLLVAACRTDGQLRAVVALYLFSERPLRIARLVGHGAADELGAIAAPADAAFGAWALDRALAEAPWRWQVFLAEDVPAGSALAGSLSAGTLIAGTVNPVLRAPAGGWEAYLASRSANFRQQVRRRERNLARAHRVDYRLCDDPDRLEADLDALFALHAARWGDDSVFGGLAAFHREFAAVALRRGWLRLWLLELDGRAAAAWYGFRFAGVESYYQAGWDPAFQESSVGFVLLGHSIREALEDGMTEYRFLRGDEAYKSRFADEDRRLETIALSRTLVGRAAIAAEAATRRRPGMRRAAAAARSRLTSISGRLEARR